MAQMVKNLPAIQETWVQFLSGEDPLEKGMAIHLVSLPGELQGQRSLVGYSPWGCKEWMRLSDFQFHRVDTPWVFLLNEKMITFKSAYVVSNYCDPMDYSLPDSSVHGISQARILDRGHFLSQRIFMTQGSNPRLLHMGRWILYHWATWDANSTKYTVQLNC